MLCGKVNKPGVVLTEQKPESRHTTRPTHFWCGRPYQETFGVGWTVGLTEGENRRRSQAAIERWNEKGVDGVAVQSTDETAAQVLDALNAGRGAELTATVKVTDHKTESRKVDYTSPNGDPHMVINLSEQKVYAYKGSTLVKTFIVSTGKPSTPTDNGTFFVHTKYQSQTMRGEGYVTPNVPWVTYYNQGEGFHGAPWNTAGIASGTPKSHGCTNMHVEDAKWVYDFLPIGAMVQIVGTTPTSAVR